MNEDKNFTAWAASVEQEKWAKADLQAARLAWDARGQQPIDMVLFCPACGVQHIDTPDVAPVTHEDGSASLWDNPPHRSHLCHNCGLIWRPADVPTNGVAAIKTKGQKDS